MEIIFLKCCYCCSITVVSISPYYSPLPFPPPPPTLSPPPIVIVHGSFIHVTWFETFIFLFLFPYHLIHSFSSLFVLMSWVMDARCINIFSICKYWRYNMQFRLNSKITCKKQDDCKLQLQIAKNRFLKLLIKYLIFLAVCLL